MPSTATHSFASSFFQENGYVLQKRMLSVKEVLALRNEAKHALNPLLGPVEFEVETGYPGAPTARDQKGGETPRRLLHAYSRSASYASLGTSKALRNVLNTLMGSRDLWLSQSHHNCVMTKHPCFSSSTSWHQDIRYWSFDVPELVSVWCALGPENERNGGLAVIPGSHAEPVARGRLDRNLFLRTDLAENQKLISNKVQLELEAGDMLFFHCRLFHAAQRNITNKIKYSVVFTYHTRDNNPIPGTRSDRYPSIPLQ